MAPKMPFVCIMPCVGLSGFTALFALISSFSVALANNGGQASCPCTGDNTSIPKDHVLSLTDYGTSCRPWDEFRPLCDPDDEEYNEDDPHNNAWCRLSWCYVDGENCAAKIGRNVFGPVQSVIFPDVDDLFYSYETCGSPDLFKGEWNYEMEYSPKCACTGEGHRDGDKLTTIGSKCEAWDQAQDYCDPEHDLYQPGNDLWCSRKWCHVPAGCVAEFDGRNYTSIPSVLDNGLHSSYETCGDANYLKGWNYEVEVCQGRAPLDVYLLVDSSESVKNDWSYIQQAASKMASFFDGENGDRVALILFGGTKKDLLDDDYKTLSPLSSNIDDVAQMARNMERLRPVSKTSSPHTWTYSAINHTMDEMDLNPPEEGHKTLLVIITDGKPNPTKDENPCDTNINVMHPRDELDRREVKTLIFEVRQEFDDLDCLVDDPKRDIIKVADPQMFFDGVTEDLFCVYQPTGAPTAPPTCKQIDCGPGTEHDEVRDWCVPLEPSSSCGRGTQFNTLTRKCVPACPYGYAYEYDGETEKCIEMPDICGEGTRFKDGKCVPSAPVPVVAPCPKVASKSLVAPCPKVAPVSETCECGMPKKTIKKGHKYLVGPSFTKVRTPCECQFKCSEVPNAVEWMFRQSGLCTCHRFGKSSKIIDGKEGNNNYVGATVQLQ